MEDTNNEKFQDTDIETTQTKKRDIIQSFEEGIITLKLFVLLDKCSISDRHLVQIISFTAEALEKNP